MLLTKTRSEWRKAAFPALLAAAMVILSACTVVSTASNKRKELGRVEPCSLRGTGREFGRGLTNVGLSWLEVPYSIEHKLRAEANPNVLSYALESAFGAVEGGFETANRAVGGAVEMLISPFPPYEPLMAPSWPPYVGPAATPKQKEPDAAAETPGGRSAGTGAAPFIEYHVQPKEGGADDK